MRRKNKLIVMVILPAKNLLHLILHLIQNIFYIQNTTYMMLKIYVGFLF